MYEDTNLFQWYTHMSECQVWANIDSVPK